MHLVMKFFGKINLSSFVYTRRLGVETFSLLVEVTLFGGCMTYVIGFSLYCFAKILSFLLLSYLSFYRKTYQSKVMVGQVRNSLFFLGFK